MCLVECRSLFRFSFLSNLTIKNIYIFDNILLINCPNNDEYLSEISIKDKIHIYEHVPSITEIKNKIIGSTIIILDDNYISSLNNSVIASYFTRGRHENYHIIFITQSLFKSGKYSRDISLNANYFIITKIRDLSQIQTLSRQIFGKKTSLSIVEIYQYILSKNKYSHMLIDLSIDNTPNTIIRSNIIPDNKIYNFEKCYKIFD